jgi:hypothetical protein
MLRSEKATGRAARMVSGPNLKMFILDSMQDDIEDLASIMRYLVEWRFCWPRDFTEAEVAETLKSLLETGLVEAYEETPDSPDLSPAQSPRTDHASLSRYWFLPTLKGKQAWADWDAPSQSGPPDS